MGNELKTPNTNFAIVYSVDKDFDSESFMKLRLRVCHDGVSPNSTYFTKEVMEDAKETIKNKPILAHVIYDKDDEDDKPRFGSHDYHIEKDRLNEGEYKVIYDEIPIGVVPESCNYTIEEYDGKNYVFVDAYIFRDYANYSENLLEDAVNTKISMEISIPDESLSYNAKEKYWEISKYKYRGISVLNNSLNTGMAQALATTENFSLEEHEAKVKERMIILMEALQNCLSNYNKEILDKGGNELTKFEKLLKKYNITKEDVVFEVEGLSDEELEAKFAENFEMQSDVDFEEESSEENANDDVDEETDTSDSDDVEDFSSEGTQDEVEKFVKAFTLSHEDIRAGLYSILSSYEDSDGDYYYIMNVFDNHFEYQGWASQKIYRQSYIKDGDNLSFEGERIELYQELLTASEKAELESLRSNYETLQEFKSEYEKTQKETIFESKRYSVLVDNKEFIALKKDAEKYAVDEIEKECKVIYADYMFSLEDDIVNDDKDGRINILMSQDDEKKPYGGYFEKYVSNKN